MKRFLRKAGLFFGGLVTLLAAALFWVPNPGVRDTMLGSLLDKHALLEQAGTNRIIFVGGSNVSMGLDSARIRVALQRPVIDSALHGALGLRFMLHDTVRYIRPGDTVVVVPEYQQFYTPVWYGETELVAVAFDICPETKASISKRQWAMLLEYMPVYAVTKVKNAILRALVADSARGATRAQGCSRTDYNSYGDIRTPPIHSPGIIRRTTCTGREEVNPKALADLCWFREQLRMRGAHLLLMPPVYQESVFDAERQVIDRIDASVAKMGIPFLASPERYRFADRFFADTSYHLVQAGVDLRTTRVIEDLRADCE